MARRTTTDQGTIIIFDIGHNVGTPVEKGQAAFFEKSRDCVISLLERKIFGQPKSLVGLLLLGSTATDNNMAEMCAGEYKHIQLLQELAYPDWNMIRQLPKKPTNKTGDWIQAVIVAADHFKSVADYKITNKRILLMTNFDCPTSVKQKNINLLLDGLKTEDFSVDVLGPSIEPDMSGGEFDLIRRFVEETNGVAATFEEAKDYLLFQRKKTVKSVPWNVDLSIGKISIPISTFIKIRDEPTLPAWKKSVKDPVSGTFSTSEGIAKDTVFHNQDNQSVVSKEDVIKGYHYGQKIIPFPESDASMLYSSGEKCLKVYGFTPYEKVSWQCLAGDGMSHVAGRKGNKKAKQTLQYLARCLHELNLVAVARKVHYKNSAAQMFALIPVIDSENVCFSMVGLCFKDDIKQMSFPKVCTSKNNVSEEQVAGFKNLIKAMDLTKAYDKTYDDAEAFPIGQTFSPYDQYILDCLSFRAKNPKEPLPPPRDEILKLFQAPQQIKENAEEPLKKLKSLFILNKVEVLKRVKAKNAPVDSTINDISDVKTNDDDMPSIKLPDTNGTKDLSIGTVNPIADYTKLKAHVQLGDLAPKMTAAIENLVYCNLDGNYSKALDALDFFRQECAATDPTHYNNWLQKFKIALQDRKKFEAFELLKNKDYILKSENSLSALESGASQDDAALYDNDTLPNSGDLAIASEVNDFFDNL